ncbi:MAG: twin-arginine translocase subunit TatA [Gammaproteobacteria bacterium HGW-Gammaproteobacteria-6]|jgi:sec-independent protein translocase protein TatA|nr:MAG: twin-arginine translocase subunit TatA [Gammaproteobacteria bacterium HGW-Gammaproteobacteria-6]PKM14822.1 MAG: twin-arginine translocase subunit TatA [Gammaproteobacteria bacterium HGW-Gammaproteobacteria-2]
MGIGWQQLLIVLVIVLLIFGTKRLKNVGSDLGEAIKGFKKGMNDAEDKDKPVERLKDDSKAENASAERHDDKTRQ